MKEKLLETEKPSISAFQASLLADADVAKKVANALHTKNTANFVTLIQNCSGVVLTSGIGIVKFVFFNHSVNDLKLKLIRC